MEQIQVLSANYGTSLISLDATSVIQNIVNTGQTSILVNNSFVGDPVPGIVKQLRISFIYNGNTYNKTVNEGEYLSFKPFKGDKLGIFYTNNKIHPKILNASLKSINKCNIDVIVSCLSDIPIDYLIGEDKNNIYQIKSTQERNSSLTIITQILQSLYEAKNRQDISYNYVSFLEHNVLYHISHFDYPLGDIMFNTAYLGLCDHGYQLRRHYHLPSYQLTMKFDNAIPYFEAQRDAILNNKMNDLDMDSHICNTYLSIIPSVYINYPNNEENYDSTFSSIQTSAFHPYWGIYTKYLP